MPRGVGGRIADELGQRGFKTTSFSVDGTSTWPQGFETNPEIIDKKEGAVRFDQYELWGDVLGDMNNQSYGNVYCEEYTQLFKNALNSSEMLNKALSPVKLVTDYQADGALGSQLRQVARLIKARGERQAERDFFFVQIGGWDTHTSQAKFDRNLEQVDNALKSFVEELEAQNVFDSVTLMTASDFGRTLTSNGAGTDHGWAGNHIVLGGAVNGGRIFNDFPTTFAEDNEYDAGRGRVIPKHPWESVMVPIAEWMGVEDMTMVFPNLGNFNRTKHIINQNQLFRSAQ